MNFQDLVDKIGIGTVFQNTSVDMATQNCILEWLFDYDLCDDDETMWLRKFRRRCNDIYPKYLAMVRVMTVKDNMDPFITVFMEKIHNSTDLKSTTLTLRDNGAASQSDGRTIVTDRDKREIDNRTMRDNRSIVTDKDNSEVDTRTSTDTYNNLRDAHDRGQNGIVTDTFYDDYRETTTGSSSGRNSDVTSGDPYAIAGAVDSNGESRSIGIAYPEANMGSIPNGVASESGATSDIAYATNESRQFSKNHAGSQRTDNHLDQTVTTNYSDSNSNSKTINGTYTNTETGTDTTTRTGSVVNSKGGRLDTTEDSTVTDTLNRTHGGSLNTDEDITVTDNLTRQNTHNSTKTTTGSDNGSTKLEMAEQGRTESPADILPRAINAIIGSDEIQYLITSLMPCFDCFGRL